MKTVKTIDARTQSIRIGTLFVQTGDHGKCPHIPVRDWRAAWRPDPKHDGYVFLVSQWCVKCRDYLSQGPASDTEATAVEAEAARLALHRIHDDWPDDEPDDEWANMGWAAYELGCEVYDGTWHGWLANHIVYEYEADQVIATHTSGTEEG